MKTEEVFGHKAQLEDYRGNFPFTAVFHDIQDDTVKLIEVTEEAYNQALKTFENNDNVSDAVIFKYMSKHDTVETEPYFKDED